MEPVDGILPAYWPDWTVPPEESAGFLGGFPYWTVLPVKSMYAFCKAGRCFPSALKEAVANSPYQMVDSLAPIPFLKVDVVSAARLRPSLPD